MKVELNSLISSLSTLPTDAGHSPCINDTPTHRRNSAPNILHPANGTAVNVVSLDAIQAAYSRSVNDLLEILQEQAATVTNILNDVLSMQKIEDGALSIEV